ncbi:alpha/beta hydrolase [Trichocoleus sp. FACHB-40]|nr:alpha/beta hydrolase [Trichocoleus sp. FACHB-40]MBD2006127.1 alpha/beta hydrolase [Trichocoleus sp. FACHB-40]
MISHPAYVFDKGVSSVATLRVLSIASAGAVFIVGGIGETAAARFSNAPLFNDVGSYSTTISANNDLADIYFPNPANLKTGNYSFPIALLLQGANVDKSNYTNFASTVASYGFVVVVPNHQKSLPQFGFTGLLPETSQLNAVLVQMVQENSNSTSPVAGVINTQKLALLGHSQGGAVGLSAIANLCLPILCEGSFSRPNELVAGAFFGANLRNFNTQEFIPINNSEIPTALLQGNLDNVALPVNAQKTYEQIQNPPKALITVLGANHYGITNTNNPVGARPDINPTIAQDVAVETVARWSALFLRASVLDDKDAFNYVYSTGDALDVNVNVTSQSKPVPESSLTSALVLLSGFGAVFGLKKRRQLNNSKVAKN